MGVFLINCVSSSVDLKCRCPVKISIARRYNRETNYSERAWCIGFFFLSLFFDYKTELVK